MNERRRDAALRSANRAPARRLAFVREWLRTLAIAFPLFFVVRAFVVEAFKIPSASMEGTLLAGDFLLVNKLVYGAELPLIGGRTPRLRTPARGDVIVFVSPSDGTTNFVKRIVAVAGDTLAMRSGRLVLNGREQAESYIRHLAGSDRTIDNFRWQAQFLTGTAKSPQYRPSRDNWGPLVVPQGSYFVLGDNRDNSFDSRYWGFVPDSLVRGQPVIVYYSLDAREEPSVGWLSRVRWSRLGSLIE